MKKKVLGPIAPNQKRRDSWSNLVTLLGTSADKRTAAFAHWDDHDPEFYEQLYSSGGIPARIVDLIPEESLRHWVEWIGVDKDTAKMIDDKCQELDVRGAINKSWRWGRAYGGGACHIVTDTSDPASPLRIGERVIGLRDLSRWDLRILTTDVEFDFGSPNFGHPRIYYLNVQMGSQFKGYPIHWTRILRFDGQLVPRRTYIRNNYWHDSILNRLYNSIRNYETANDSVAACLQDFNVDVFKMKNLANMMGAGNEKLVAARIQMLQYSKSVINSMLIDADDEDYENKQRSMQGIAELLVLQANRLVAETDIPHTKLLGESPDGSNATGNSTSQQWYNFIAAEQENYLRPKLKRLLSVLFPNLPQLDFKFRSLRVLDDIEKADVRQKVAQTDQIYVDMGALDASEITTSRFGGDEWSMETELDIEGRASGAIVPGQQPGIDPNAEPGEGDPEDPNDNGGGSNSGKEESNEDDEDEKSDPKHNGGEAPPEGKAKTKSTSGTGEKREPPPSEPEPGNDMRGHEGEEADITGVPEEEHPEPSEQSVEGQGIGELFSGMLKPGTEFEPNNSEIEMQGPTKPAEQTFISQTMSEPMRDPRTDPHIKGPGIPNKPRKIMPTRGNGVTAPSGAEWGVDGTQDAPAVEGYFELERQDAGKWEEGKHPRKGGQFSQGGGSAPAKGKGGAKKPEGKESKGKKPKPEPKAKPHPSFGSGVNALEIAKEAAEKGSETIEKGEKKDMGVAASMEEFNKGSLRSSSGAKVTDPKQAAAIGYSEEKAAKKDVEPRRRAATVIVKKGDKFLMGRTNKDGRWTLPGGVVEDHESLHGGAVRELSEETGVNAKKLKFLGSRLVESEMGKPYEVGMYEYQHGDEDAKPTGKKDPDKEVDKWEWISHKEPLHEDIQGNLKHPNNIALDHLGLLK